MTIIYVTGCVWKDDQSKWILASLLEYDIGTEALDLENIYYQLELSLVGEIFLRYKLSQIPFQNCEKIPLYLKKFLIYTPRVRKFLIKIIYNENYVTLNYSLNSNIVNHTWKKM